jgi:hypothetical protein
MNWWEWIIIAWAIVAIVVPVCGNLPNADIGAFLACLVSVIAAVALTLTLVLVVVNRSVTRENCHNWGVANERPVKFASYTFWNYGCVTPDGYGRWIPTNQIIVNVPKPEA